MRDSNSTLIRLFVFLGLALAGATSGCKIFEREVTALDQPEEEEGSPLFPVSGTVRVVTRTTGSLPDHDGYSIWHEHMRKLPIGIDETLVVNDVRWDPGLFPRWYLGRVGPQCKVVGGTRFPERPETWYMGRWFLNAGGVVERTVDVVCDPSD